MEDSQGGTPIIPSLPNTSTITPTAIPITALTEAEKLAKQVASGRIGGSSRSEAKRAAVRLNLAKARANRWPGREAANTAVEEAREAITNAEEAPDSREGSETPS